jgi:6-phosphogluconolactonase (cycloisomerase 2 family)
MKLSLFGRLSMALFASLVLGLGMTACGGGTIGYMWVLGQEYNQISGFRIDDYTGNLTAIPGSPFGSNGSVPVSIVVKPGGRYIYVINQGLCPAAGCGTTHNTAASIAVFSVGGEGTLSFQQSFQTQGYDSQWAQFDSTGTYLYVLDKYSPGFDKANSLYDLPNSDGNGAITAYAADPNTGRLSLVQNTNILTPNGTALPFFEVGGAPFQMKSVGGCLFTVNSSNQSYTPYAFGSGGLLNLVTTSTSTLQTTNATSINGNGTFVIVTDGAPNTIHQYTVGTNCSLAPVNGSGVTQQNSVFPGTSYPSYSYIDSTGKYLYITNGMSTSTTVGTPYSSITAYIINSTNQELSPISGAPYTVGSGPVCIVEDPTNQYFYISNHNDGTVTGKLLDSTTGILSSLTRGSTFTSSGQSGCLALSGSVD